eukprot:TRINITY_DN21914_c0_g1_i2.p1 TRINITY_DN21914_c0_g1~~TRINITY_DN21914_c0_g1_i2.p1  ORF type:complete len:353 (+),score=21.97 TRINITY_DN21914_c0_g1_i2:128-1186(+)
MPLAVYDSGHGTDGRTTGLTMLHHLSDVDGGIEPFRSRQDTMYLDGIRPKDVPRGKVDVIKEDTQALRTHDIMGAQPRYLHAELHKHGPPAQVPVPGSRPISHYPQLNRVRDMSLTTVDIEKGQPMVHKFQTHRNVNPLTPRYELPSVEMLPPEAPQPVHHEGRPRDTLELKGESTPRVLERNYARDPNDCSDIDQSKRRFGPRTHRLGESTPRDPMRMIIEQAGSRILSSRAPAASRSCRGSCPLDPVYDNPTSTTHPLLRGDDIESEAYAPRQVGLVEGAAPRVRHKDRGEPQALLATSDIKGAQPQRFKGGVPFNIYDSHKVPSFERHMGMDCSDISGAQPGTRKPGTL